jgi:hypothetical protein
MISASLERNGIRLIVREKVMAEPLPIPDPYAVFPRTWAWFTDNFDHIRDFGNFEIWVRHEGSH